MLYQLSYRPNDVIIPPVAAACKVDADGKRPYNRATNSPWSRYEACRFCYR
jgi:hypothetical protein